MVENEEPGSVPRQVGHGDEEERGSRLGKYSERAERDVCVDFTHLHPPNNPTG